MARMHETCFQIEIQMQQARLGVTFNYLLMQIPRHCDNLAFEWFPPASAIFKYIYILQNISCHFDKYNFKSISFAWLVPLFHQPLQSAVACQTKTFSRLKAAQAFTSGLQPSVRWTTTLYIFRGAYDVCGFVKNLIWFKENYFRIWPKKIRFVLFLILLWGKGLPSLLFLESVDRQLAGERACWQKERHSYSFFWLLWTQYCQPPDNESFPWEYWACGFRLFVSMGEAKKSEKYYFSDCGNTHITYMFTIHYDGTYSSSFLN